MDKTGQIYKKKYRKMREVYARKCVCVCVWVDNI